jgi:hypothetical protein
MDPMAPVPPGDVFDADAAETVLTVVSPPSVTRPGVKTASPGTRLAGMIGRGRSRMRRV